MPQSQRTEALTGVSAISGSSDANTAIMGSVTLPFLVVYILAVLILMAAPQLALWPPRVAG